MKKFLYYFLGAIALFSIWTYVVLPLMDSKPKEKEWTEPSVILGRDDINDEAAFFKRWRDKDGFFEYNPLGYQYHKNIYNYQTGKQLTNQLDLYILLKKVFMMK